MVSVNLSTVAKHNSGIFRIEINDIPRKLIKKQQNESSYILNFSHKRLALKIILMDKAYYTLMGEKSLFGDKGFSIQKQSNNFYQIRITNNLDEIIKNNHNGLMKIKRSSDNYQIDGAFSITMDELIRLQTKVNIRIEQKKNKKEAQKKREIDRKENVRKMAAALTIYESKQRTPVTYDQKLKNKKIYLRNPLANKRCENCISLNNKKCMTHNIEVSNNHGCARFHTFRTFHGGGFSPR